MTKASSRSARRKRGPATARQAGRASAEAARPEARRASRILDLLSHAAVPGLFFVFVWSWHPFHHVFEFDPDEGNEVIKALMLAKGHALYSEVWSDQPPLFSYMLRGWFAVAGWSVHNGRLMVLTCSALLLWAVYQTVRLSWGRIAALASAVMLIASYRYLALSVAVMQAVPTLMFAMLSIYSVARFRRKPHPGWALASGVLLALSLFVKPFTLPVAPLILLALAQSAFARREDARPKRRWLLPVALWCGGGVTAAAAVVWLTIPLDGFMQFIEPHLAAQEKMAAQGFDRVFSDMVRADYAFALLGLPALLRISWKRDWFSMLPVAWCLMSYGLLWSHRPLWYHHYILLGVPLCWTAGIAVGALFSGEVWRAGLPWRGPRSALAMVVVLLTFAFGVLAAAHLPQKFARERDYAEGYRRMTPSDLYTVAVLEQFKGRTDFVVTDRQMLAFSAGIIVPPELSVTSVKRMHSGNLSMDKLLNLLERYEPGVIHLSWRNRIPETGRLKEYLREHYRRLYSTPYGRRRYDRFHVRKTLGGDPVAVLEAALAETPESWEGHFNLGVRLARAGRDEEAVEHLRSAVAMRPVADAYLYLGASLKRLGRRHEAAKAYEISGKLFKGVKREREAAEAFEQAGRLRGSGGR